MRVARLKLQNIIFSYLIYHFIDIAFYVAGEHFKKQKLNFYFSFISLKINGSGQHLGIGRLIKNQYLIHKYLSLHMIVAAIIYVYN